MQGANIVVLDLETEHSAEDGRHCGLSREEFHWDTEHVYEAIGWNDHAALGLSIGCYYDYKDGLVHWFDRQTVGIVIEDFLETQPLVVSFNGIGFDFPLMCAVW